MNKYVNMFVSNDNNGIIYNQTNKMNRNVYETFWLHCIRRIRAPG